ncbi:DNA adenine methylase [Oscillospiraceae bacterium OttesenSCG-928-G22]|nr:DNA adenine methylase [Oscillospiraceae bacterium OttesenSCG-928-G22]
MTSRPNNRGHPMTPPISWVGGKRSILPEILSRFPLEYDRYIEVFGGSGVVLFGKEPTPFEVWNDMNGDLHNFYHCVKNKHLSLLKELGFLPLNSRAEFFLVKAFLNGEPLPGVDTEAEATLARKHLPPLEAQELCDILTKRCSPSDISRAVAFYRLNRLSYGAKMDTYSLQPCDLRQFYDQITAAHDRLSQVILENKDFENIIKIYDRPGAFFYCDPPYFMAEDIYAVEFSHEDHYRLFQVLTGIKGKWLLSYNDDPFVRKLYKDFPQYRFTRINNLVQRYESGAVYGEIIIANFDLSERARQNEQLTIFTKS